MEAMAFGQSFPAHIRGAFIRRVLGRRGRFAESLNFESTLAIYIERAAFIFSISKEPR